MMVDFVFIIVLTLYLLSFISTSNGEHELDHTFSFQPFSNGPNAHNLRASQIILKDRQTIQIHGLYYDGKGPAAYWMVGYGQPPVEYPKETPGFIIPNEEGNCGVLKAYNGNDITLTLPINYTIGGSKRNSIEWLAIYCIQFKHNFGHIRIPKDIDLHLPEPQVNQREPLQLPKDCPQNEDAQTNWNWYEMGQKEGIALAKTFSFYPHGQGTAHGLKADRIILQDQQTIEIQGIYYDGKGPDTFWMVGFGIPPKERPGQVPGHKIPNENGTCDKLDKPYTGQTIKLKLPSEFTIGNSKNNSIEWLALFCIHYKHNFGHVQIPKDLNLPKYDYDSKNPLPLECSSSSGSWIWNNGQNQSIFGIVFLVQFMSQFF